MTLAETSFNPLANAVIQRKRDAVITADEVDGRIAPNGALEYDLRGNVHVTMNPEQ